MKTAIQLTRQSPSCFHRRWPLSPLALAIPLLSSISCNVPGPNVPPSSQTTLAPQFPGIQIDAQAGVIDLEAIVVQREATWLELLAASPGTREHETIVTVTARPSQIHLALILLGLEPGQPTTTRRSENQWLVDPPSGPPVEVFFVWEQGGCEQQIPAHLWVQNQQTGRPLQDNIWLFSGSRFQSWRGQKHYLADDNGTVISLVNFGDDLLARRTHLSNQTDNQIWSPATDRIPAIGTHLTLRLRVVRTSPSP